MTQAQSGPPAMPSLPKKIDATLPPLRLAVYGEGGVGKTQLALSFPNVLVVDTDNGLTGGAVQGVDGERWRPEKWRDLNALYFWLKKQVAERGYETIVIDSISSLARVILHEAVNLPTKDRPRNAEDIELQTPTQQDYGKVSNALDKFLSNLVQLQEETGIHIVITSAVREPDPEKGRLRRSFDVQPAIESILMHWPDVYGELVIQSLGTPPAEHRVLRTTPADNMRKNKTRFAELLPGVVDPTFSKIRELLTASTGSTTTTTKKAGSK